MVGGGVIAAPLMFILGFYLLSKPGMRLACLALAIGWMLMVLVLAVIKSEWILTIFPAIIGISWSLLHPMLKEG